MSRTGITFEKVKKAIAELQGQLLKHVQQNLEHYQAATQQLRQEESLVVEKQQEVLRHESRFVLQEKFTLEGQFKQLQATLS